MNKTRCLMTAFFAAAMLAIPAQRTPAAEKIPIIHSTDLFHPHDDPDDHFDLACLFALKEFNVKGIVARYWRGPGQAARNTGGRADDENYRS